MDTTNDTEMVDGHVENVTRVMTRGESIREVHRMLLEAYKHYEPMNGASLLILIITMIVVQVILIVWKRRHFKSFKTVTSLALWMIPVIINIDLSYSYWKFIVFWTLFSLIAGLILWKTLEKPLQKSTPRLVYKIWFYFIYKLTFVLTIVGSLIMVSAYFGINVIFNVKPAVWIDYGIAFLAYGFYFGVLGQDVAKICAFVMAANLGYYTPHEFPTKSLAKNICAVCGNKLPVKDGKENIIECTFQLTCGHIFHEFCIQGWCLIGKNETCPYCKEEVDLNLWGKHYVSYGRTLALYRRTITWAPTFTIISHLMDYILIYIIGLK